MAYYCPDNLSDALKIATDMSVTLLAGGTDLYPATDRPALGGDVLDITRIEALKGIARTPQGWRIGAATCWSDLVGADLPAGFHALQQAARQIGSVQIQNAGTLGGNICNASPAADGVPPLLAMGAEVELASMGGTRRLALDAFIRGVRKTALASGEIVVALHIPTSGAAGLSRFAKLGARASLVISIVMVAVRVELDGGVIRKAAVAVGACSPVARRLAGFEAALVGATLCDASNLRDPLRAALRAELDPIGDIRGSADYRRDAAEVLILSALSDLTEAPA